jgi:hypothetical protein
MKTTLGGLLAIVLAAGITQAGGARAGEAPTAGVAFNGRTSYAQAADPQAFDLDAFSVSAWAKFGGRIALSSVAGARRAACSPVSVREPDSHVGRVRAVALHARQRRCAEAGYLDAFLGTYDGQTIRLFVDGRLTASQEAPGRIPVSAHPADDRRDHAGPCACWTARSTMCESGDGRCSADEAAQVAQRDEVADGLVAQWTASRWTAKPGVQRAADPGRGTLPGRSEDRDPGGPVRAALAAHLSIALRDREPKLDGYRSIWYYNQPQGDEYVYKYSGGLGTYTCKHRPLAVYRPEVNKTFFCYGGTDETTARCCTWSRTSTTPPAPCRGRRCWSTNAPPTRTTTRSSRSTPRDTSSSSPARTEPAAFVHLPQQTALRHRRIRADRHDQLLLHAAVPHSGQGVPFPADHLPGRPGQLFPNQPGRLRVDRAAAALAVRPRTLSDQRTVRDGEAGQRVQLSSAGTGLNWRTNLYYMETSDFGETWPTWPASRSRSR